MVRNPLLGVRRNVVASRRPISGFASSFRLRGSTRLTFIFLFVIISLLMFIKQHDIISMTTEETNNNKTTLNSIKEKNGRNVNNIENSVNKMKNDEYKLPSAKLNHQYNQNSTINNEHKIKSNENRTQQTLDKPQHPPTVNTPSVIEVQHILESEDHSYNDKKLYNIAQTYALSYAIIAAFQRRQMPVSLYAGSHLGALRHHGIIPFQEKDIDLALWSTDHGAIEAALNEAIESQNFNVTIEDSEQWFGYQIENKNVQRHKNSSLSHYIDVWLFETNEKTKTTKCVGWKKPTWNGCDKWFKHYHGNSRPAPVYRYDDWFPVRTQIFGTERCPIPATNVIIERFPFDDKGADFWNTTCGPHRRWNGVEKRWKAVEAKERRCSNEYERYPFVFLKEGGREELRRGSMVLHEVLGVQ